MTRVAAIDCGTNSIRLLIAERVAGRLVDVDRRMEIVRLGEGIDRTGEFSEAALGRTFDACERYAGVIARSAVDRVRFVATSASRDAHNRAAFMEGVRKRLGVDPEVISGDEEARLSFAGAVAGLAEASAPAPRLVVDIGGGSTEFVLGDDHPVAAQSVDIGCVRMTERHLHGDPPTAEEVDDTLADIHAAIDHVETAVPLRDAASLIGLAGTVTTMAALALDLSEYDPAAIHGSVISASDVAAVTARLLTMSRAERAALAVMHPGRVDVVIGGALVLRTIVDRVGVDTVVVSEHDILDGIVRRLADIA